MDKALRPQQGAVVGGTISMRTPRELRWGPRYVDRGYHSPPPMPNEDSCPE